MPSKRPWQRQEWLNEGRRVRDAWRKLERWGEDSWPLRDNWPPRISPDKRFGLSQTEAGADRLLEARQRAGVDRQAVAAAVLALGALDYELFRVLASREGMPPFKPLLRTQLVARLRARGDGYSERRLDQLLAEAWAFVAFHIRHGAPAIAWPHQVRTKAGACPFRSDPSPPEKQRNLWPTLPRITPLPFAAG